ncbi:hypothetical protein FHR83_001962 [Actinoplanes campanulatus]|uniref:Uncharacterized protein n=1 Tax=Actinoplanes campanulatus TaxID=113559 RepID=A0A7W5AE20_9ACTN|nr:hypothetical protein [Actinoplanes campanulatus]MBB3094310.1 hypothetical protein [Actinoplanes campanulatus]GGN20150.1 hypothetical protein GCM10010109_33780 [Actinoplanes campanulatus]GID35771.1 hypothetical protein Aca09nite_22770 [Actinoplanes campanulatus]
MAWRPAEGRRRVNGSLISVMPDTTESMDGIDESKGLPDVTTAEQCESFPEKPGQDIDDDDI